jgi:hypothetical protein
MKTVLPTTADTSIAASIAPEDLQRGNFVAVLSELVEFPSFFWCDSLPGNRTELVRVRFLPTSSMPLKIEAICLPFVFVKSPLGQRETLDIRRVQLVQLEKRYAKTVWKQLRKQRPDGKSFAR